MIRITIEGADHEKVGKELKEFFVVGQRKVVRHYKQLIDIAEIPPCDVAIFEIENKNGGQNNDTGNNNQS